MTTHLHALIAQRAEIDACISVEKAAVFATVLQTAADTFTNAGVALDEGAAALLTLHNKLVRSKRKTGTKVAPKYRHKATGATWTGRGKQPAWYAAAEQSEIEHLGGDLK